MCILCGTPDPAHELVLLRAAMLTTGAGVILAPRELRHKLAQRLLRLLPRHCRRPKDSSRSRSV
jgi:hypothetical protein